MGKHSRLVKKQDANVAPATEQDANVAPAIKVYTARTYAYDYPKEGRGFRMLAEGSKGKFVWSEPRNNCPYLESATQPYDASLTMTLRVTDTEVSGHTLHFIKALSVGRACYGIGGYKVTIAATARPVGMLREDGTFAPMLYCSLLLKAATKAVAGHKVDSPIADKATDDTAK